MADLIPVVMPQESVTDERVLILKWLVADKNWVKKEQVLAEVETSKAVFDIESPAAGYVRQLEPAGTEVAVGAAFAYICPTPDAELPGIVPDASLSAPLAYASPETPELLATAPANGNATAHNDNTRFPRLSLNGPRLSPAARAVVEQHRLPLDRLNGLGLVRAADVLSLVVGTTESSSPQPLSHAAAAVPVESAPGAVEISGVRREPLPRRKRLEARLLGWAVKQTLPSSVSVVCPTRGLRDAISRQTGGRVSAAALVVFETSRLLRKYPAFNAVSLGDLAGFYEHVNIGVAMDDGGGLVVPVIREADRQSLFEIADELRELTVSFVDGKLTPEQLEPGTFTISDLSGFDAAHFSPMINRHQSAILGVGAEQFPPEGGASGWFTLTLTFDHSLAEGRTAALFVSHLKQRLASYERVTTQNGSATEACCLRCLRTAEDLQQLSRSYVLLRSEVPKGMICSLCLAGY